MMTLGDLFDLPPGHPDASLPVTGLASDSRKVKPGDVFVALEGLAFDGRAFVADAVARGAVAVLAAPGLTGAGVPVVESENPRLALSKAASRLHPNQPATVVAVTGTNGKSSTVDFLRQIWTACGHKAASIGTLGAIGPAGRVDLGFTTPDPISLHATLAALAAEGVTHAAMEASSHALDQHRMDGVRLAAGGFTNLTQDHLDYHGTMDAYRAAKMRLFTALVPRGGPAIINADAAETAAFEQGAGAAGLTVRLCGWRGDYLKIAELWPKPASQRLDLQFGGASTTVEIPLIGEFQALNAVTAAGFALALGERPEAVFEGMRHLRPVMGRMEHVGATASGAHVFVDYAHTPDGLDVLLRAARPHAPGRIILVFGCGGDRDRGKRPKMGEIASRLADVVIVTDDNPRSEAPADIRAEVLAGCPGAFEIGDRGEAIRSGVEMLKPGDALLIAGKGHETGQIIGGTVLPFSDQETARAALAGVTA